MRTTETMVLEGEGTSMTEIGGPARDLTEDRRIMSSLL